MSTGQGAVAVLCGWEGRQCSAAGEVTVGLASHWPCVTDFRIPTCELSGLAQIGRRAPHHVHAGVWQLLSLPMEHTIDSESLSLRTETFLHHSSYVDHWANSAHNIVSCNTSQTMYSAVAAYSRRCHSKTPFTRYNRLSNRFNNRLNNWLHREKNIQPVVKGLEQQAACRVA